MEYGKGFNRTSVFRMVKFYEEFLDKEKVATLSQQLTWSHFVELLPIEDGIKRDFMQLCAKLKDGPCVLCGNEKNPCSMKGRLFQRNLLKR